MENEDLVIGRDPVPTLVRLTEGERLRWTLVSLDGEDAELSVEIDLDGEGADVDIAGLFPALRSGKLKVNVLIRHNAPRCTSRQMFRILAGGDARVTFDGLVYVGRDALRTSARQECHSILLCDSAVVEARPQLEIYADDVECSHGATTGYLNPDELFYMRSRGIPEKEARALQMISFVSPVSERLPEDLKCQIYESLH